MKAKGQSRMNVQKIAKNMRRSINFILLIDKKGGSPNGYDLEQKESGYHSN